MSAVYFWYQDEVVTVREYLRCQDLDEVRYLRPYRNRPCVDAFVVNAPERYGRFAIHASGVVHWLSEPVETLPPEFRAYLLLMGVS